MPSFLFHLQVNKRDVSGILVDNEIFFHVFSFVSTAGLRYIIFFFHFKWLMGWFGRVNYMLGFD